MVFIILLATTFFCSSLAVQDPIAQVISLRELQKTASYNEYYDYEKQLVSLKQSSITKPGEVQDRVQKHPLWPHWRIVLVHSLPFLLWQLLALISALFLLRLRGRSVFLWLIFILSIGVVWAGFQERSCSLITLTQKTVPLRIGPGERYPVSARLDCLDEVFLLERRAGWAKVSYNNRVGWIAHD
jgi:hypothetical protein